MSTRLRQFVSAVGTGLNNMAIASHDSAARQRVQEIDEEMEQLRMERDYHIASLHEPRSDEVVSNDYVPGRYHPKPALSVRLIDDGGRLTECRGRSYPTDRYVHPGCPYGDKNHGRHEFTLRD